MKKTLLLVTTAILGISFQAQAVVLREYAALRGGLASMKHETRETYNGVLNPVKNNWDGDAAIGSVAYGLKAGYLRAEVEGNATSTAKDTREYTVDGYTTNMTTTARINTTSLMFNSYLELPIDFPLRPYIGAGIGMAHINGKFKNRSYDGKVNNIKISRNHFAWQVGAGLAYEITPHWSVDLGYRFMNYGEITKNISDYSDGDRKYVGQLSLDAKVYSAYLGARYTF